MQIVSIGDSLHEISKPVFLEISEKYFNMSSAENFTQSTKCYDVGSRVSKRIACSVFLILLELDTLFQCLFET